jgi:hypothetical protein
MYSCPACGFDRVEGLSRCRCGADLSLLAELDATVDAWFNAGLDALGAGDTGGALEWLAAYAKARPTDAAGPAVLARLWLQLGHPDFALRCLDRAAELELETPERSALRALALGDLKAAGPVVVPGVACREPDDPTRGVEPGIVEGEERAGDPVGSGTATVGSAAGET